VAALFLVVFTYGISYAYSYWITNLYVIAPLLEIIRITYLANRRKQRGARILVAGSISFVLLFALFNLFALGYIPAGPNWLYGHLVINTSFLSLPIALSVYLALESSYASRTLTEKLVEVQQLSQEKETILANQNETLERQVKERTAALHHSLQELKAAQKQLIHAEKMASLGELTAGIAHEIQNPLNFVNNFSETNVELLEELKLELEKGNIGEANTLITDAIENEQKITHHGRRADSIVKGMLEHSRTSSGKREPTDLNKLADEYLRLSYHGLRAKDKNFNAVIQTNFDESIGKVSIIPQDIGRVLLNLFNNAFYAVNQKKLQATEEYEPTVSISTKKSNNAIEIAVRDNGMGIPSHIVEKIFQPFFTTKPTGQGTGLGLSLSYDIVRAHGGELKVSSTEGGGTAFTILLPS
jgi:signal transduction histidine kinase